MSCSRTKRVIAGVATSSLRPAAARTGIEHSLLRRCLSVRCGVVLAITSVLIAGCSRVPGLLDPKGPVSELQREHLWIVTAVMMLVVLPVFILTPLLLIRYRYGRASGDYRPSWSFDWRWELALWGVPALVVLVLGTLLWRQTHRLDPYREVASAGDVLRIQVVGFDWKWLFIYPDQHIATVGVLVLPAGRPLALQLTSETVMQSFFVPALGSQIYAMHGMVTQLHLAASDTGDFDGENTQYSGEGFHRQHFDAEVVTEPEFKDWVGQVQSRGLALNGQAMAALEHQGSLADLTRALGVGQATAVQFRQVPEHLFSDLVAGRGAQQGEAAHG